MKFNWTIFKTLITEFKYLIIRDWNPKWLLFPTPTLRSLSLLPFYVQRIVFLIFFNYESYIKIVICNITYYLIAFQIIFLVFLWFLGFDERDKIKSISVRLDVWIISLLMANSVLLFDIKVFFLKKNFYKFSVEFITTQFQQFFTHFWFFFYNSLLTYNFVFPFISLSLSLSLSLPLTYSLTILLSLYMPRMVCLEWFVLIPVLSSHLSFCIFFFEI
jgi:hypothetical protein